MMRLFFNSTMRAPLSAEPFYTYIILSRLIFVKRFFAAQCTGVAWNLDAGC